MNYHTKDCVCVMCEDRRRQRVLILEALKARFPWLSVAYADYDEPSGADIIDEMFQWYSELGGKKDPPQERSE